MQSEPQPLKNSIPWLMAATRAALGPTLMLGDRTGWSGVTLAAMVITGLLSDIFDGVLARRWNCASAAVRLFDSMADIVFYLGCAAALWIREPHLMRSLLLPIAVLLGLEALKFAFVMLKFGKPTSYHSYLAKTWGLVLAMMVVMSFTTHMAALRTVWWIALTLGVLSCLEGLAMSVILPEWRHDLKTLWRALEVRRQILLERNSAAQRVPASRAAMISSATATMLLLIATVAHASSIPSVTFVGGSAPGLSAGASGALDTGTEEINFQWSGGSLAIPYARIQNFSYREQRAVHLGILPTIFVRLIRPAMFRHVLSISYLDASGNKQVAVFEVPKEAKETLPDVMQERTGICTDASQLPCHVPSVTPGLRADLLRRP